MADYGHADGAVRAARSFAEPVALAQMPSDRGTLGIRQVLPRKPLSPWPVEQLGVQARPDWSRGQDRTVSFFTRVRCRPTWLRRATQAAQAFHVGIGQPRAPQPDGRTIR
jgi:hypothetical protein